MKEVTNNQLFEYMTMMYGEVVEIKNDLNDFKQKSAVFEEKTDQRLKALFDGYDANTEAIGRLEATTATHTEAIGRLQATTATHTEAITGLVHEVSDLKKIVSHHEVKFKNIK